MSSTSAPNPVWISKRDGCSQNGIEPAWRDVRQDQRDIGVEGMDIICRKTMARCQTPGMRSPHGGCQPDKGFEAEHLDLGKFVDWVWALKAERDQLFGMTEQLKAEIESFKTANAELSEINVARRNHLSNAKKAAGIGPMDDLVGAIEALRKGAERWKWLEGSADSATWEQIGYQEHMNRHLHVDAAMSKEGK